MYDTTNNVVANYLLDMKVSQADYNKKLIDHNF